MTAILLNISKQSVPALCFVGEFGCLIVHWAQIEQLKIGCGLKSITHNHNFGSSFDARLCAAPSASWSAPTSGCAPPSSSSASIAKAASITTKAASKWSAVAYLIENESPSFTLLKCILKTTNLCFHLCRLVVFLQTLHDPGLDHCHRDPAEFLRMPCRYVLFSEDSQVYLVS